jgi:hypothetical protein
MAQKTAHSTAAEGCVKGLRNRSLFESTMQAEQSCSVATITAPDTRILSRGDCATTEQKGKPASVLCCGCWIDVEISVNTAQKGVRNSASLNGPVYL